MIPLRKGGVCNRELLQILKKTFTPIQSFSFETDVIFKNLDKMGNHRFIRNRGSSQHDEQHHGLSIQLHSGTQRATKEG